MDRIAGIGRNEATKGASSSRRAKRSDAFNPSTGETTPSAPVSAITVTGLLGAQEDAAPFRRNQAARHSCETALDALSALQAVIVSPQPADVGQLRHIVETMPTACDPALQAILQAIRLRGRVEIARARRDMTIR